MQIALTVKEKRFVEAMEAMAGSVGKLSAELNYKLAKSLKEADAVSRQFAQGFGKVGDKMQSFGQNMSMYVTAPLTLMAGATLNAYGELDSLERSLMTVEGTSENLQKRLGELREAAKLPGLGFQEAIKGDVALRSVGIAATTSLKILKEFGNANAMGGGGKEQLSSIITQLAQMSAKSKVLAEDLKPIITAAPTVAKALKEMFGTVDSGDIQKKLEATGKNSQDFIEMLLTTLEKAPRVTGGFKNAIENVKDSLFVFSANMGKALDKAFDFEGIVNDVSAALNSVQTWFNSLSPEIQKMMFAVAGLTATIGPLMVAIGGVIKAYGMLFSGTAVLTAAITAAALAIGGIIYLMIDYSATKTKIANASKSLAQIEDEVRASIHSQAEEVRKHTDVLNNNNSTLAQRKTAIEALKTISPEYFGKLDSEKIKYDDLNVSVSKYITNLENAAKANLIKSQIESNIKAEKDLLEDLGSATSDVEKMRAKFDQSLARGFKKLMGSADDSQIDNTNRLADVITLNAANALTKIRQSRVSLEEELVRLAQLGYKPTEQTAPKSTGGGAGSDKGKKDKFAYMDAEWMATLNRKVANSLGDLKELSYSDYFKNELAELQKLIGKPTDFQITWADSLIAASKRLKDGMPKIMSVIGVSAEASFKKDVFDRMQKAFSSFGNLDTSSLLTLPALVAQQLNFSVAGLSVEKGIKKNVTDKAKVSLNEVNSMLQEMLNNLSNNVLPDAFASVFESIGSGKGLGDGLGNAFKGILSTIGQYMIDLGKEALMATALIEGLKKSFGTALGPAASIALIAGGGLLKGLAGSLFSQTPKFAQGGMVTGPTFAMMGDNASGREMALPWEKTGVFAQAIAANMSGGGGAGVGGNVNFRLRGEDLYGALQQYMKNNGIKSL